MIREQIALRSYVYQGRIQDFHLGGGGGGAKDFVSARTLRVQTELTFGMGPGPA